MWAGKKPTIELLVMKNYPLLILLFFFVGCKEQPSNEIYIDEFKWSIRIPEIFSQEDLKKWEKTREAGRKEMEKTVGHEIVQGTRVLFVFRDYNQNYFEANTEPYDTAREGDYIETCERMNDLAYQTIVSRLPGATIDTSKGTQLIDNLLFQKLAITTTYPDDTKRNTVIYRRLFDTKEITIGIMYVDNEKGKMMEDALLLSKFGKK